MRLLGCPASPLCRPGLDYGAFLLSHQFTDRPPRPAVNYLVKWWELGDTVFLVLKRKNLEFLHVYHHSMTMILCFVELKGRVAMQWVVITLNLFVHVIMYYYYARTNMFPGEQIWWKRHLTTLQITQFVIDLVICYLNTYTHFAHDYYPSLPNYGPCAATDFAALFGSGLLSTYLLLFVDFFVRTYIEKIKKRRAAAAAKKSDGAPSSPVSPAEDATRLLPVEAKANGHSGNGTLLEPPLTPRRSARRAASREAAARE
ncbi:putative elongation of fatty acids protein 2 [Hyaloraphidium curvatum]|nr:putative elongation of fatty acids protein 2 [Hyaloraphidium curvatum]